MAFSSFTYPDVIPHFGLTEGSQDLFAGVPDRAASAALRFFMDTNLTLANLINTEKARSELLVAPVLSELFRQSFGAINLFSGMEFNADPEAQLTGFVDFMIGLGPQLPRISTPVVMIFEAKRDNIADATASALPRWSEPNATIEGWAIPWRRSTEPSPRESTGSSCACATRS